MITETSCMIFEWLPGNHRFLYELVWLPEFCNRKILMFTQMVNNKAVMRYVCDYLIIFQKAYDSSMITGTSYSSYLTLYDYREILMAINQGENNSPTLQMKVVGKAYQHSLWPLSYLGVNKKNQIWHKLCWVTDFRKRNKSVFN